MADQTATAIAEVLDSMTRIAIVGLSNRPSRPSYGIARRLQRLGYDIIPVNPNEHEVLGVAAVDTLADVDGPIDVVNVFRRASFAPEIAHAAVAATARMLWLQQGIRSDEARQIAHAGGLVYVEDRCLGVEVGLHSA